MWCDDHAFASAHFSLLNAMRGNATPVGYHRSRAPFRCEARLEATSVPNRRTSLPENASAPQGRRRWLPTTYCRTAEGPGASEPPASRVPSTRTPARSPARRVKDAQRAAGHLVLEAHDRQMLGSEDRSVRHNARPAAERCCPTYTPPPDTSNDRTLTRWVAPLCGPERRSIRDRRG